MSYYNVKVGGLGFIARRDTCDEGVIREVVEADVYKLKTIDFKEPPVVVDVGGHIGSFTRAAAAKWPSGKFFTYEANPMNYDIITRNLSSITSYKKVFLGACVGAPPANKFMVISKPEADSITGGWGILYDENPVNVNHDKTATVPITNFYSLVDLFEQEKLSKIHLLKLDCEGSEFSIIKELPDELLAKIDIIVAEVHCGALPHAPMKWDAFRAKLLSTHSCPDLEARKTVSHKDLFNIVLRKK